MRICILTLMQTHPQIKSRHVYSAHVHTDGRPSPVTRLACCVDLRLCFPRHFHSQQLICFPAWFTSCSHNSLSLTAFSLFLTTSMKVQAPGHHRTTSSSFRHLAADTQEMKKKHKYFRPQKRSLHRLKIWILTNKTHAPYKEIWICKAFWLIKMQ